MDIRILDLDFLGHEQVIASFLVPSRSGFLLVETGPGSTLGTLERRIADAGYERDDLVAILVTHIHLDHAGAAGALAAQTGAPVYVHPVGATHLADPSRLLRSAGRLYGDLMDELWGETKPVPEEQVRAVADAETIAVDGVELRAWHTPGHAGHHIAWQLGGSVFSGDVGGVRIPGSTVVQPPTPPPEIDLELWRESLAVLRHLRPDAILPTHFGRYDDVERHVDELDERLAIWAEAVREPALAGAATDEIAAILERISAGELEDAEPEVRARYEGASPARYNAEGLARYWRKRAEKAPHER